MTNITDADKILRNDTGKDIASKLDIIAGAIGAEDNTYSKAETDQKFATKTEVAETIASQYDSENVIFDSEPTSGHGTGYTVTSAGVKEALDTKVNVDDINAQFDIFNLYDKNNNVVGYYINNNGLIVQSDSGATYAVVPVENGKTYTICRIGYQAYSSGRMLVVKADKTTVLDTVNLNNCVSVTYDGNVAKKYTVNSEQASYILFNVKLGTGDSINSTIVTERDINGSQETYITSIYDCKLASISDIKEINEHLDKNDEIIGQKNKVSLLIAENKFQVRSAWDSLNDIAILGSFNGSSNGGFTFEKYATIPKTSSKDTYGGTTLSFIDDDICPIKFKGSYIGGNHGYAGAFTLTTTEEHGITASDIGKTITDANSNTYVILSIPTTKTIFVCSTYQNDLDYPITTVKPVSPVTINGNSVVCTVSNVQQLRPAINNIVQKVVVDGARQVSANGVYDGKIVEISEEYNIINIGDMLTYLANNIGSNDNDSYHSDNISAYCKVVNRYRFTDNGGVTLYNDIVFFTGNKISYFGVTQTSALGGSYISVPKSSYNAIYNMGDTTVDVIRTNWDNADNPPRTFYKFTDANMSSGMVLGYHDIGSAKDNIRKDNIGNAIQYYGSTHKLYPRIYALSEVPIETNKVFSTIAFRTPSKAEAGTPFVTWYYVDETPYLLINAQNTYNGFVSLPDYFAGKVATVIETDGAIDIQSAFVNSCGLFIDVTGYGYAVVRLD